MGNSARIEKSGSHGNDSESEISTNAKPIPNKPLRPRKEYDNPFLASDATSVPDFPMVYHPTSEGKMTSLWRFMDENKPKALVLVFWASWDMSSCTLLMRLESLYRKLKDDGLAILGVSIDGMSKDLESRINKALQYDAGMERTWTESGRYSLPDNGSIITYPIIADLSRELATLLEVDSIPTAVVIERDHMACSRFSGPNIELARLENKIQECMANWQH